MPIFDWNNIFDKAYPEPGATEDELDEFVATVLSPLSREEIEAIRNSQSNPFPEADPLRAGWTPFDPANWTILNRPVPPTYLSLLRWSNGANCRTGEKLFQFFPVLDPVHGVRAMLLGYHVPEYLPGFLPFAFDGCGTFYLFDMRQAADDDEYPIVCCDSGCLDLEDSEKIADSFLAACRGEWISEDVH